jgi:hypothetical protein
MAIINGQLPTPAPISGSPRARVVVKFKSHVTLPYSSEAVSQMDAPLLSAWRDLATAHPGIELVPYFASFGEVSLRNLAQRTARAATAPTSAQFAQYYAVRSASGVDAEAIVRTIAQWPTVELVYVEAGPVPPPVNPADDPLSANEGYLNAAPLGVDARFAWNSADGSGVGFVDLERGWTLNHEDLAAAGITIISGLNQDYPGHGTAVLGEVLGVDNNIGGIGIAPNVHARVVSQWRTASDYNTAEAILSAVAVMQPGDVLQLEAQTTYLGSYAPVEVEAATFDAIQYAVSEGIIVIEAGGNGSLDLDTVKDANGKTFLNRSSADFRDSGAILVGAASSTAPHSRLSFSNYGSRIDCFAWGENITTCGDGWTGNLTNSYTNTFGGTSGATPMVTGSALLVQSWRIKQGFARHSPAEMRGTLSAADNTPSANPSSDRIGLMPNLKSVLSREARARWILYLAWAWMILVGGLLITPGGVLCIRCGPQSPGFVGDIAAIVLGAVSVALGIVGVARIARQGARAVG